MASRAPSVTQNCLSLPELRRQGHVELGWHPNFLSARLTHIPRRPRHRIPVPEAGASALPIRGTLPLTKYRERLPTMPPTRHDGQPNLRLFSSWTGMIRSRSGGRMTWCSDAAFRCASSPGAPDGLRVINVHPVLHALNAADFDCYESPKAHLRNQGRALTDATRGSSPPGNCWSRRLADGMMKWLEREVLGRWKAD